MRLPRKLTVTPARVILVVLLVALPGLRAARRAAPAPLPCDKLSGRNALLHAEAVTQFGPRPPGSAAHARTRKYIETALESWKLKPEVDAFPADTPMGKAQMHNIVARIGGKSERAVIVAGHYDTKQIPRIHFVGANDGGSSTGLLLEMARTLAKGPQRELSVWVAFLDGEEAQAGEWTAADSLYGSKRMARQLQASGKASQVAAVIVVDMVGGKNLNLLRDRNSTGWLNDMVREVAAGLRLEKVFGTTETHIEDDHLPFLAIGLPAVDLIDFSSQETYWHTEKDTTDKLSAASLETAGRIVLCTIDAVAKRTAK